MTEATKDKPNGVLFRREDGTVIAVLIKNNKWDWENCNVFDITKMEDKYDDLSFKDPFEFVFIIWDEERMVFTSMNTKTYIPNYSMSKLLYEDKLQKTIEKDYEQRYGSI